MNMVRDSCPTQQWRHSTRQTTDNNILWRCALQKSCVNKGITNQSCESQPHGEVVSKKFQHQHTDNTQYRSEHHRLTAIDAPLCHGTIKRARHFQINMLIDNMIHRRGRGRTQRNTEIAKNKHLPRHSTWH